MLANHHTSISCSQSTSVVARRPDDYRHCHHALDVLPCPLVIRVLRGMECGSHAAAAAVLTIRRMARR